ncbi:hypothetical protein F4820DRAFT_442195 [Hypoxylon rubiginosum]|uniref:Uncharacterized protein n=1 Tax=Hypoxylon rubiginosum TaxID=110542 RepID=A0ACB9YGM1_9PEZI|nr:hypothetical protein F4820DRAFT_442195 [Hypoxylon rubiginosum]
MLQQVAQQASQASVFSTTAQDPRTPSPQRATSLTAEQPVQEEIVGSGSFKPINEQTGSGANQDQEGTTPSKTQQPTIKLVSRKGKEKAMSPAQPEEPSNQAQGPNHRPANSPVDDDLNDRQDKDPDYNPANEPPADDDEENATLQDQLPERQKAPKSRAPRRSETARKTIEIKELSANELYQILDTEALNPDLFYDVQSHHGYATKKCAVERATIEIDHNPELLANVFIQIDVLNGYSKGSSYAAHTKIRAVQDDLKDAVTLYHAGEPWEHLLPERALLLAMRYIEMSGSLNAAIGGRLAHLRRLDLAQATDSEDLLTAQEEGTSQASQPGTGKIWSAIVTLEGGINEALAVARDARDAIDADEERISQIVKDCLRRGSIGTQLRSLRESHDKLQGEVDTLAPQYDKLDFTMGGIIARVAKLENSSSDVNLRASVAPRDPAYRSVEPAGRAVDPHYRQGTPTVKRQRIEVPQLSPPAGNRSSINRYHRR